MHENVSRYYVREHKKLCERERPLLLRTANDSYQREFSAPSTCLRAAHCSPAASSRDAPTPPGRQHQLMTHSARLQPLICKNSRAKTTSASMHNWTATCTSVRGRERGFSLTKSELAMKPRMAPTMRRVSCWFSASVAELLSFVSRHSSARTSCRTCALPRFRLYSISSVIRPCHKQ